MEESDDQIDLGIFNVSLENDDFIANLSSSPLHPIGGLDQPDCHKKPISLELFETMECQEEEDICSRDEQDDVFPECCESMKPERTKWKGNPKFRESLAWDSAFFTEAGVLDPEELSYMIKGTENGTGNRMVQTKRRTENGENCVLSGINEDVEQSIDSISAIESEDVILEQLEAEFFKDIRASIQRSSEVSNVMISSSSKTSLKAANEASSALKEADCTSKKMVPKVASKKTIRAQTSGMSKSQQKHTGGVQGSGKAATEEKSQVKQAITRNVDSKSLLARPPKLSSKEKSVSAAIAKGASTGANHVKSDHVNAKISTVTGKGAQASKVFAPNNARKVFPKHVLSLKPSSIGFSSSANTAPRSSSDSTASTSSEKTGESTFKAARKKVESRPARQPSSGSIIKTPPKNSLKNDISSRNSAVTAYVMSSKMSPGVSPASSISKWSSISSSSSSSSSINKRSNGSRNSLDTSRSVDSNSTNCSSHRRTTDKSVPRKVLPNDYISKPSRQNGTASMKPSGLRMPSQKIGFFDEVKPVSSPSGSMHSNPKGSVELTKHGANVKTNTKTKTAKLPPAKTLTVSTRQECDTMKCVENHLRLSQEVHHEMRGDSNLYPNDVVVEGPEITKHVADAGLLVPVKHEDQGLTKLNLNDIKTIAVEGGSYDLVSKNDKIMTSELTPSTSFGVKMSSELLDNCKEATVEIVGKTDYANDSSL